MTRIYLNDSEFFKNLRKRFGIEKPEYAGIDDWDDWEEKTQREHPVGYWFTETLPDGLNWFVNGIASWYYTPRYYIRNRFIRKTHYLRTDVKPGTYSDLDYRIQSALIFALVDFVEIELAYKSRWCVTEESKTAKWKDGRCPELGLEYLKWEMTLTKGEDHGFSPTDEGYMEPTHQAIAAKEIYELYQWCKNRENRPDVYDVSGWTAICEEGRAKGIRFSKSGDADYEARKDVAFDRLNELEREYEAEDDEMLMRIIKVRRSLWA